MIDEKKAATGAALYLILASAGLSGDGYRIGARWRGTASSYGHEAALRLNPHDRVESFTLAL